MLSLLCSFFQHANVLTDEIFQVLEGSKESLEEVRSTNYKVKKHRCDASLCGFCDFDDTCRQCEKVFNSITK